MADLAKYCNNLTMANLTLQQKLKTLEDELIHTRGLLANVPTPSLDKFSVKEAAEEAVLREIHKLNKLSMEQVTPLDKEDTQKLKQMVEAIVAFRNKGQPDKGKPPVRQDNIPLEDLLNSIKA